MRMCSTYFDFGAASWKLVLAACQVELAGSRSWKTSTLIFVPPFTDFSNELDILRVKEVVIPPPGWSFLLDGHRLESAASGHRAIRTGYQIMKQYSNIVREALRKRPDNEVLVEALLRGPA